MAIKNNINVREITQQDFNKIADYWLLSNPDFLVRMGVDLQKLPSRYGLINMLKEQLKLPLHLKQSYALIWELDHEPIGHSNVNNIEYGKQATMHLHLWNSNTRKKGFGTELIKKTLPFYFKNLKLKKLICEPYALNPAPNRTLHNVGFHFIKKYTTIPGTLNFEQEVNRWELESSDFYKNI